MPPSALVACLSIIFAAAALPLLLPCTAKAEAEPVVENLAPTSPAAQDFIRARCEQISAGWVNESRMCYEVLLPYATSINGSYTRAAIAGVTVMVSKLTALATELPPGECAQVVNAAISGANESALPRLGRLDAMGDDKVQKENPDLAGVSKWVLDVNHSFTAKCREKVTAAAVTAAGDALRNAVGLVTRPRPNWDTSLPSPDGSGP